MSDTTTIIPIAAFDPANRFVTFEGLKDYDANLISNLHSLGYNNKVSGANIFAWGNNNRIDGQNLFVFGNEFSLTSIAKRPSMFIGHGSIISESGWNDTENTIFGVWHEYSPAPIFRVGAEETSLYDGWLSAAFSIGRDGSFYAANGKFIVDANGSFHAAGQKFNVGVDGAFSAVDGKFNVTPQGSITTSFQRPDPTKDEEWWLNLRQGDDNKISLSCDDRSDVSIVKNGIQGTLAITIPKQKMTILTWTLDIGEEPAQHLFSLYVPLSNGEIVLIAGTDIPETNMSNATKVIMIHHATTLPFTIS